MTQQLPVVFAWCFFWGGVACGILLCGKGESVNLMVFFRISPCCPANKCGAGLEESEFALEFQDHFDGGQFLAGPSVALGICPQVHGIFPWCPTPFCHVLYGIPLDIRIFCLHGFDCFLSCHYWLRFSCHGVFGCGVGKWVPGGTAISWKQSFPLCVCLCHEAGILRSRHGAVGKSRTLSMRYPLSVARGR